MATRENTTDKLVPMAFRHRESTRLMLRAIGKRRGHGELSDTLREAVDRYVETETTTSEAA